MYNQFFNLKQAPFSIAPDPRYLFMSERHREALAHLLYGINSGGGFVLLTGEIGAGKTTICRCFLEQVPANCNVAYIFNPKLTVNELLQAICDEFRIQFNGAGTATVKDYVDALNTYLLKTHAEAQNNVLIIDEAQNLLPEVLEQLRLLTNLETNERKLLQIILIGQPELRTILARPELEQLAQRVIARYHLDSLSAAETAAYIRHRMSVAGLTTLPPFKPTLMKLIHQITQGVPRRINLLCDRALLGAYAESKHQIDKSIISKAAAEVFGRNSPSRTSGIQHWHYTLWGIITGAAVIGAIFWTMNHGWPSKPINLKSKNAESPSAAAAAVKMTPAAAPGETAKPDQPVPASPAVPQANQQHSSVRPAAWDLDDILTTRLPYRIEAIRELAQLWGLSLEVGLPCLLAQQANLHCYVTNKIEFAEIRRLNRPAVLTLHDDGGRIYYALLTGLSQAGATLRVGGVSQSVSVSTLTRIFQGGFLTLWRAPYTYRELIGFGYRGEEADWIAEQLAKMDGRQIPRHNQMYDQKMVQQVREFQRAQGIQSDGIVGPKTFMQLNRLVGIKEPLLQSRASSAIALAE